MYIGHAYVGHAYVGHVCGCVCSASPTLHYKLATTDSTGTCQGN